jgi:hypothetical protein
VIGQRLIEASPDSIGIVPEFLQGVPKSSDIGATLISAPIDHVSHIVQQKTYLLVSPAVDHVSHIVQQATYMLRRK